MQAAMNICQVAWEMMGGRLAATVTNSNSQWIDFREILQETMGVFPSNFDGFPVKCVILCYIIQSYPIHYGNKRLRSR
jgi:hypothetical protein